ncbi:MAG: hypothetical protein CFH06_01437 [Alphaproteobacteria bacterium MarineAlpha3_Bin5]|nr:MAG: hypothetical protein CFH06_01437 [Alphaproteobacteria bacterium MarineAlpha3_Bin5]
MDRDTLNILLNSGKYLCFNPVEIEDEQSEEESEPVQANSKDDDLEVGNLFDSPILEGSVFFKEVATDERTGRLYTATRFLLAFNFDNPYEGGASFEIIPGKLDQFLTEYYGGVQIHLTSHDNCVLEVFNRTPTFDPFMLLAQREFLQRHRPINDRHFAVGSTTAEEVRSIISVKARQLVNLAANAGIKREQINSTVLELEDAIWHTKTNEGTSRVFSEMGITPDKEDDILLAWKGISYYEYMLNEFKADYLNMLRWLGSDNSFPSDIGLLGSVNAANIYDIRKRAKQVLRMTYLKASIIMENYHDSYNTLIRRQDPVPFHTFLTSAPVHFEQIGMCVGSFGHVNNAWKTMTNHGHFLRPKSDELDKFYRFVCDLLDAKDSGKSGAN